MINEKTTVLFIALVQYSNLLMSLFSMNFASIVLTLFTSTSMLLLEIVNLNFNSIVKNFLQISFVILILYTAFLSLNF